MDMKGLFMQITLSTHVALLQGTFSEIRSGSLLMYTAETCNVGFERPASFHTRRGKNMRGKFVSKAFQDIVKSEKIMQHEQTLYHQAAMEMMQLVIENYENPTERVNHDKSAISNYDRNVHVMRKMTEAEGSS